ncbi:MAG TPA: lipid A-modifier LpxR family protein, partial [Longimicrobium sp.]
MPSRRLPHLTLLLLLFTVHPLAAQVRSFAVTSENDAYNFWIPFELRPDEEYTNGVELAAELEGAPLWGRFVRGRGLCGGGDSIGACLSTRVRFGQKIFTPRTQLVDPVGERPYAGWLYLGAAGIVERARVRRSA